MKKIIAVSLILGLMLMTMSFAVAKPLTKDIQMVGLDKKCFFKDGSLKPNAQPFCIEEPQPDEMPPIAQPINP